MDDILKNALEFSNYNQTLNIQRKLLKDQLDSLMQLMQQQAQR